MNCKDCKDYQKCIARINIWDGSWFFRLPRTKINSFKRCQLIKIKESIETKDLWNESDFRAVKMINRLLEERRLNVS